MLISSALLGQNKIFEVSPELIYPGDTITITYRAAEGVLNGASEVSGRLYMNRGYQWEAHDLDLESQEGQIWQSQFVLPTDAALITCIFQSDTLVDRGGIPTYSWMVTDAPGSYVAWAMLRSPLFQNEVPNIVADSAMIGDDVMLMWVNNELMYWPESNDKIFYYGLYTMTKVREGDLSPKIKAAIRHFLATDQNHIGQYDLQRSLGLLNKTEHEVFIDSVEQSLLKKYPKGVLARDQAILAMFREADLKKKAKMFKKFEKNFPTADYDVITDMESLYLEKVFKAIAYTELIENHNYDYIFDRVETCAYNNLLDFSWHLLSIPFNRQTMSFDSLKWIGDQLIPELEKRESKVPKMYKGKVTPKEWKEMAIGYSARDYLIYAFVLDELGYYEDEKRFVEKLAPIMMYKVSDYNGLYSKMLLREDKKKEALEFIKACVNVNNATPAMLDELKKNFVAEGGKEEGFDQYLQSIKSEKLLEEQYEEIIGSLINQPIESFNLENLKGEMVSLADQEGKVVVLDFWATWCAPCKKAMPGMELAVNKYAEDVEVAFFFVDTQETTKNYREDVRVFIEEKGYPFEVLFDGVNSETNKLDDTYSKYAKAFSFSGIPQKMVIDQNGNLRWRSTGYYGSPSKLADEFSIIIEYLKAENGNQ